MFHPREISRNVIIQSYRIHSYTNFVLKSNFFNSFIIIVIKKSLKFSQEMKSINNLISLTQVNVRTKDLLTCVIETLQFGKLQWIWSIVKSFLVERCSRVLILFRLCLPMANIWSPTSRMPNDRAVSKCFTTLIVDLSDL